MHVAILGPLDVRVDGVTVTIGGARLRALVIRLALDAPDPVTVDALTDALWGERPPADPANAVQSLVSRLRRLLPRPDLVHAVPGGYRLDVAPDTVDAHRFERLARAGHDLLATDTPEPARHRLDEALGLWRGAALAEVADAPYARAAVARLDALRHTAAEDRVDAALASGRHDEAVAELKALVAEDPLRERPHGQLMRALYATGQQAAALAVYDDLRRRLVDELGVVPSPDLQDLHLAVLSQDPALQAVPAPSRPAAQGNIAAPLTRLIGRADEAVRLTGHVADERLVTLVGPGGTGKTRLATTVAGELAAPMPGGAWLVELAPLTDPDDVPTALLTALGQRDTTLPDGHDGPRDATSRLVDALAPAETLLVLDNCEHLVDAVARMTETLLGGCPRLHVLATSRTPLGLVGERLQEIPPLGLPPPGAPAAAAAAAPAVELFAERAAAVVPGFTVTDEDVATVAAVCRRLDGLPLAIELAAARLRALPLMELAARLDDRFRLLTGGSRTALPRHRTLHATVAWSWDLLDDEERRFAERLAVFPATITPAGAAAVAVPTPSAADAADGTEVLDALATLVDKSLLQAMEGTEPRYRMLETIRAYGRERLAEAGDLVQARAAHAAYVLDLAEHAAPHLRGHDQLPWIRRLTVAAEDHTAALHLARGSGDAALATRLGAALGLFWTIRGDHSTAADRLRQVLEVPGDAPEAARAAATAFQLLNTALSGAGPTQTEAPAPAVPDEARPRRTGARPAPVEPWAQLAEAAHALVRDDVTGGLATLDGRPTAADPWTRAMLALVRSFLTGNHGDLDAMRRDLERAVAAFRDAGERWGLATSLTYLAYARTTTGELADAADALEEAARLVRALDPDDPAVLQRVWLAEAHARQGDPGRARAELQAIVEPDTGTASTPYLTVARIALGDMARHDGDLDEAARQYDAARELADGHTAATFPRAMADSAQGHLAVSRGEPAAARPHLAAALAVAAELPDMPFAAGIGIGIARMLAADGDAPGAAEALGAADVLRGAAETVDPDVVALDATLRAALGERAYRSAYDRGLGWDRSGALALFIGHARRR